VRKSSMPIGFLHTKNVGGIADAITFPKQHPPLVDRGEAYHFLLTIGGVAI
jgi:hypothetical protein